MKLNHALMDNNFTKSDMDSVIKLVKKKNIIPTHLDHFFSNSFTFFD